MSNVFSSSNARLDDGLSVLQLPTVSTNKGFGELKTTPDLPGKCYFLLLGEAAAQLDKSTIKEVIRNLTDILKSRPAFVLDYYTNNLMMDASIT